MGRRSWGMLAWGVLAVQPLAAGAQQLTSAPAEVGGSPASDLVVVSSGMPTVPLRHGGIIARSERVFLNGQELTSGVDYSIDYDGGVLYLMGAGHSGQTVNVSYRYTPGKTVAATGFGNGINTFQFNLLPGALNMRFGFGLAERAADGTVLQSNIYGLNTNYGFGMLGGKSTLTGLVLFGNRQEGTSASNYEATGKKQADPQGQSRFVVENLATKLMGGTLALDYQDISKNFTAFSATQGSGFDSKVLDQFQKEAGLTRMGFGLSDLSVGGLKLSNSFHEVKDGASQISWKSFGVKEGPLAFTWNSQEVGKSFTRFSDLGETNRTDLQREVGTKRDTASLAVNLKGATATATDFEVTDQTGGQIHRHEGALTGKNGSVTFGDSIVQTEFTGFGNLLDPEKALYGAVGGVRRQWVSAKYDFGHGSKPFMVDDYSVKTDAGSFHAQDLAVGGKTWNFGFSDRKSDPKFASFASINPVDTDASINAIGALYPGVKPNAPGERGAFGMTPGLDRRGYTFGVTPTKNTSLSASALTLDGASDKGALDSLAIGAGGLAASYRLEDVGQHFDELSKLMGFERTALGPIEGLKKSDLNVTDNLGRNHVVSFNQMDANTPAGGAEHNLLEYKDRQLDFAYQSRAVDPHFTSVGQLVDPQAGLLASLVGFKQADSKVNWAPGSGLTYAGEYANSHSDTTGVSTAIDTTNIGMVKGGTVIAFSRQSQESTDPAHLILQNDQQSMSLKQVLGNWTFHAGQSKVDYAGTQEVDSTNHPLESYSSKSVGLELKVSKSTSVASELTSTEYSNGHLASMRTDSVTTALTPRAGITVSNTQINNIADQNVDETKRNYGFWYDVAKGVRVSYGYVRDLNAGNVNNAGTLNSVLTVGAAPAGLTGDSLAKVGQGTLGDLALGGGYAANQWQTPNPTTGTEATRTQSFSNVRINTVKPLAYGALKDVKFQFNTDTATDNFTWIRQNQEMGFTGRVGPAAFGFDYHGQIDAQNEHAADRTYSFSSDPSEKRFITGSVLYKIRSVPTHPNAMIRNFDLKLHPTSRLTLSNQLQTNPEVANASVILGSVTQGAQINRYRADFKSTKDVSFGGSWEELKDTNSKAYGQTTAVNLSLFNSASPLILSYGWQTLDGNVPRQTIQRWSIQFNGKAGPNQSLNFMIGSLSYGFTIPTGQPVHGLTAQLGYQYRF
ncbi:MAG: hypothetical protein ACYC96_12485 [Fimbriimonadaceae bacterium]